MEETRFTDKVLEDAGYTLITPEMAANMLITNRRNRSIRTKFVKQLVEIIKEGQWNPYLPDHIAFYEDGTLANGQHRLLAIKTAGIPCYAKIDENIPLSSSVFIDTGKSRSYCDNVKISSGTDWYTAKLSSAVRGAFQDGRNLTHAEHLEIARRYKTELMWIKDIFAYKPSFMNKSFLMSAVLLARFHAVDCTKLSEFLEILHRGVTSTSIVTLTSAEETVFHYRDKLLAEQSQGSARRSTFADSVKIAENVIYNFVNGQKITQIRVPSNYRYPPIVLR